MTRSRVRISAEASLKMESFSSEDIKKWKGIFRNRRYAEKITDISGDDLRYFVLPSSLFGEIPNGLFRMTGERRTDGYLIGVSEQVPEIIQPHFAVSEYDEFVVYGLRDEKRTLHSEQDMVGLLNRDRSFDLLDLYIDRKSTLYKHLISVADENRDVFKFSERDVDGFKEALEFLLEQQAGITS